MKMKKIFLATICLLLSVNANAALVIMNTYESNVTVTSLTSSNITASGYAYGGYLDKGAPDCCDATENSVFRVDFDIIGSQFIYIDATLISNGGDYSSPGYYSYLRVHAINPLCYYCPTNEFYLGAYNEGGDSSASGDDWVTDYMSNGKLLIKRQILLSEGSYSLWARAQLYLNNPGGSSSDSFSLTAVPLPSGIWLFASGLIALVGYARKK